jgi:hypothetical protein
MPSADFVVESADLDRLQAAFALLLGRMRQLWTDSTYTLIAITRVWILKHAVGSGKKLLS